MEYSVKTTFKQKFIISILAIVVVAVGTIGYMLYSQNMMHHLEEDQSKRVSDLLVTVDAMEHIWICYADFADAIINQDFADATSKLD